MYSPFWIRFTSFAGIIGRVSHRRKGWVVLSSIPVLATAVALCPTSSPEPSATLSIGGLINTGRFSSWSWDCVTPAPRPAPAIQIGVVTQPAYVPFVTTATTPQFWMGSTQGGETLFWPGSSFCSLAAAHLACYH